MLAAMLVTACAWICLPAAATPADAAPIAYAPCAGNNDFACGHLTVPLDPTGASPGTITLAVRRHRATVGEAHSAIIALAGGPGQPALPLSELFSEVLGTAAATRDLIVFDQRGIGESQALSCHALERPNLYHSTGALVEACASELGSARNFYATADTVADIEALRVAGGYEKLVLYGTSYGTKVAEQYAQEYPSHVEALVLDSVVPPNGPDLLDRATFAAIPRVLTQACANRACAHITADPAADLARVLRRISRAPLRGRVIDGHGRAHNVPVFSSALFGMLLAGDFSQTLRAEFVTYVSAAAKGDAAPLARLESLGEEGGEESEDFDTPLYFATTCDDQDAPWNRSASPDARLEQAHAFVRTLPANAFAPFSPGEALGFSGAEVCAHWPYSSATQPSDQLPFPNVPTLILSGADDLRTPTANAREVAAQIPDAQLLVVPYTGHSVLTDEPTPCGHDALRSLFAEHAVKACRAAPLPAALRPPPLPPRRLARVSPAGGNRGLPGRTAHAVALTLADLGRQLVLKLEAAIGSSSGLGALPTIRVGGLRSGWAAFSNSAITLHGYSYVPGMTVSGTLRSGSGVLRVAGAAAADGTLSLGAHGALSGTLGGSPVHVLQPPDATAAIVGDDVRASSDSAAERAARSAGARAVAELLGRGRP
jgi:pimeloyl-ACP methyl ester carboxylesterase